MLVTELNEIIIKLNAMSILPVVCYIGNSEINFEVSVMEPNCVFPLVTWNQKHGIAWNIIDEDDKKYEGIAANVILEAQKLLTVKGVGDET